MWWMVLAVMAAPPAEKSVAELVSELNGCIELDCEPARALIAKGPTIWPDLQVGLEHKDEMTRFWSLGVLTEVPVPAARPALISLLSDKTVRIRAAAAFALGAQRSPEVVEPLLKALFDADVNVRFEAASALSRVPDKRAVEPLIEVMADPDHDVRGAACEALGAIGDARAMPTLVARLMDDRKPGVRGRAALALGAMKAPAAKELAKRAGRERDAEALAAMAWALGEVGASDDGVSVAALETLGKHTHEVVRQHAADALASISKRTGSR
jgi:HEAT repeat protein